MNEIIKAFHHKKMVTVNDYNFILNPLTEQIPETTEPLLRDACAEIVKRLPNGTSKLLTEEDKGGILAAGVSLLTGLSFGMARWYPSGLATQIQEDFDMEYVSGKLYLNGVHRSDRVAIIDDMVSTGGTMISLIRAVERTGATISGIISVAEKVEYGGCARILQETGYDVDTILSVSVQGTHSRVVRPALTVTNTGNGDDKI